MALAATLARDANVLATALAVRDLSHAFGKRLVLSDVSFQVRPSEFTVLLGLNGAGKTTLFSLITRLYDHRSGAIEVFGNPVKAKPSSALARMGVVFQQPTLDLDLTVEQNLYYHASLHGLPRREAGERLTQELARVGIIERRRDKVRHLSGGQRRRVEIARALLHSPSLLLLDEPTVGLDIASRQFLLDHVRKLCREDQLAVLWATHLIDEVGEDSRVIVLHKGRVLGDGTAQEVRSASGANNMQAAFEHLTRDREPRS
ncbi:MAG TPA: ABC transporter ATP-binding protein [Alphaproteobacteria bacterium]|nr:ABC transporter ATP-binding protein [Alphaproteobacteria bacterium]